MMMKVFPETIGRVVVLLVVVCQLVIASCLRRFYPEQSFQNIESKADRKKLNDFLAAGIEKGFNTQTASADGIIETAEKYLGVHHSMGGTTMKCMDCSGLLVTVLPDLVLTCPITRKNKPGMVK
jgi:hypothetical protein